MSLKNRKQKSNPPHRPPIGGYGMPTDRLPVTVSLPLFVGQWVRSRYTHLSDYVRSLILKDFEENKHKP
jgi:hypothetical protein